MTRCETTAGHPAMLRDVSSYLGFLWLPEYRVYELHREFNQTYYRAVVSLLDDSEYLEIVIHSCEAYASTVKMAVHQAAYQLLTILREEYTCFSNDRSPYRFLPCG